MKSLVSAKRTSSFTCRTTQSLKRSKLALKPKCAQSSTLELRLQAKLAELRTQPILLNFNIAQLGDIYHQLVLEVQSALPTMTTSSPCPFICTLCQHLLFEPLTLYCGHTYCEQCVREREAPSCPRCPADLTGQIVSPILLARKTPYTKNCFIKQLIEEKSRDSFKCRWQCRVLSRKALAEFHKSNYTEAIQIYSEALQLAPHDHLALHGRAEAYEALQQFDESLIDAERVIALKPFWPKGYYLRSQILFELKRTTAALLSSLQALALDPEDMRGREIMARHLHAVLREDGPVVESAVPSSSDVQRDNEDSPISADSEEMFLEQKHDETTASSSPSYPRICKTQSDNHMCLCSKFDHKGLKALDFECSICVNLFWFPVTTPCGHVFCRECLIRSIDNTHAACPMCKHSLEEFFPMLIHSHVNKTEIIVQIIETYFPEEHKEREKQMHSGTSILNSSQPMDRDLFTLSLTTTILDIPVFVCVLAMPNCPCPLHVFEPRYRLMMRRTVATASRTFGMCRYDPTTRTFADYGTLLYIRGIIYTTDGRSIVDTVGQRRFRTLERGTQDGYATARVELIGDNPVEQHEFDDLHLLNSVTYNRVRSWFDQLDAYRRTLISSQLEEYPPCDSFTLGSTDGPAWHWKMLNVLPIEPLLQYTALASQSLRIRLQMLNDTIDFLQQGQQQFSPATDADPLPPHPPAPVEGEETNDNVENR